jgi:hypothetical protein
MAPWIWLGRPGGGDRPTGGVLFRSAANDRPDRERPARRLDLERPTGRRPRSLSREAFGFSDAMPVPGALPSNGRQGP